MTRTFLTLLAVFLLHGALRAEEEGPKRRHLRFMSSYEAAMLEARIRNVPIFFSRHKDF